MKILTVILLFVAIGCYAGDTPDITQEVFVRTNLYGTIQHTVMTYRGKEKVMTERFNQDAKGKLVIWARSYFVGGDLMMSEIAEDTPGKLDTICIYHPGTNTTEEVFTLPADGSVKPMITRMLSAYKEENATVSDLFRTLDNTNTTEAQWEKKVQEIEKIQDVEKQKADGKQ